MKTFLIKSSHDIFVDSYSEGEGNYVNGYNLELRVKSENLKTAIENYFSNQLFYEFSWDRCYIEGDHLEWDVLVDSENIEIKGTDKEFDQWKRGEITLYNNRIYLTAFELVEIDIESEIAKIK